LRTQETITNASQKQRTPLVKTEHTQPEHHWSTAEGNYHAPWRDGSPFPRGGLLKAYEPPPDIKAHDLDEHVSSVILYLVPGMRVSTRTKRLFWQSIELRRPERIEIEFSCPDTGPSDPAAYKSSAVDWALGGCNQILIAIDQKPGSAGGEAHRVLAPLQVVFRCREHEVAAWCDFLQPRLRGRHRLSIIHPQILVGRA
jgi:hypothetical protein